MSDNSVSTTTRDVFGRHLTAVSGGKPITDGDAAGIAAQALKGIPPLMFPRNTFTLRDFKLALGKTVQLLAERYEPGEVEHGPGEEGAGLLEVVRAKLVPRLLADMEDLRRILPRMFDRIANEVLNEHGWTVTMVCKTLDGRFDLFGVSPIEGTTHKQSWLLECLREDDDLTADTVESVYFLARGYPVSGAMLGATTGFAEAANEFVAHGPATGAYLAPHLYTLATHDAIAIMEWLKLHRPQIACAVELDKERVVPVSEFTP